MGLVPLTAVLVLAACGSSGGGGTPSASRTAAGRPIASARPTTPAGTGTSSARTSATRNPAQSPAQRAAAARAAARRAVTAIVRNHPDGGVSVAALDVGSGMRWSAGARSGMWMASTYKLYVLEALLLQSQHAGGLSETERDSAAAAIENSDNVAGYALFEDAGGTAGLTTAARRLGMTHTVPGSSDPTFTTSGAPDGLRLLEALVRRNGPLTAASRAFTLRLMRTVESDQRWGAGDVADPHTSVAVKNGWLSIDDSNGPGETDDDRWAVNTLGVITVHGRQVLLAVFTRHNPDFATGKDLVVRLSKLTAAAVAQG